MRESNARNNVPSKSSRRRWSALAGTHIHDERVNQRLAERVRWLGAPHAQKGVDMCMPLHLAETRRQRAGPRVRAGTWTRLSTRCGVVVQVTM